MKRLTWLFKNSPFFKLRAASSRLLLTFSSLLAIVNISACQYIGRDSGSTSSDRISFRALSIDEASRVVAHVSESGCNQGLPQIWLLEFQSAFGHHQLKLDYSHHQAGEETLVVFNQHRFRAQIPLPMSPAQLKELCLPQNEPNEAILVTQAEKNTRFTKILETIAPNCQAQIRDEGLYCHLPHYSAAEALQKLTDAHLRLVTRWQRHPYLLSRRIAFARSLALAINDQDPVAQLDRMCRVVRHSIPEELPLAVRSSRWFQAACLQKDSFNREALLVSLYDIIQEIDSLSSELTSSSRLGMLSVRIPASVSPARQYWVTLKPLTVDRTSEEQLTIARKSACWHPLYDQSMAEHKIADELGILAEPSLGACRSVAREDEAYLQNLASNYIKHSIASETEFPISNGRGKVLRLPKGEYHYKIEPHLGPFVDTYYPDESQAEQSTGIVSWTAPRPHPTINSW